MSSVENEVRLSSLKGATNAVLLRMVLEFAARILLEGLHMRLDLGPVSIADPRQFKFAMGVAKVFSPFLQK